MSIHRKRDLVFGYVGVTYVVKLDIAGKRSKVVDHTVYTEVVTVYHSISTDQLVFPVKRDLIDTVDGIVSVIHDRCYAVFCSAHNDTAAEHSAEVGALYGVHHTAQIQCTETV
ncbi:MAG: hypothetical protein BWY95_00940 [Bacteroidetes bacterium ADurb.BinA104]|nr:MAG: hypothetical protein BWY95_00940 [Bacteroidetes bacterium ADurb.BinA104]